MRNAQSAAAVGSGGEAGLASMIRVPSELWVRALVRHCDAQAVPAVVVRRGDADAGTVFVKVRLLDGTAKLFGPAPAGLQSGEVPGGALRAMTAHLDAEGVPEAEAEAYLSQQIAFDPDVWVVEIDDRVGRNFFDF